MALNIKNAEVERQLGSQVIQEDRRARLLRFLEQDVWPRVPRRILGGRLTRKERETILGYGSRGV